MESSNTFCAIAKTLYPSYREHLTTPASNDFIEAHLKECESCRRFYHISPENEHSNVPSLSDTDVNLREASYLKRYRRLFLVSVLGVFLGILLFALLLINLSLGMKHFLRQLTGTNSIHTEEVSDYRCWDNYQGISTFSIFPENLSHCKTVNQYYYDCTSSSFSSVLQLYLDCSYTPQDYTAEKQRLLKTAKTDQEQTLFSYPVCYTMLFYDTACEYTVFLEQEHRILYISLQNISRNELIFDEAYLPLDYGIFGSPPENQATPYCIYNDASTKTYEKEN